MRDKGWLAKQIFNERASWEKIVIPIAQSDLILKKFLITVAHSYGPAVEGTSEEKRGLRCVWSRFYGEDYHPLYDEAMRRVKSKENRRYITLTGQIIFDAENYMKRTLMSVEMTLLEANTRAEKQNTTAFLHVVGFGLGQLSS